MNKKLLIFISIFTFTVSLWGDDIGEIANKIMSEGKFLYRLEMASWHGTDLFLERYNNRDNIGGYFSYSSRDSTMCVFFSKTEDPKIIGVVSFDETYAINKATVALMERDFNSIESDLYTIRQKALQEIYTDTLFRHYENANLNLIPLIYNGEKKVYILTGPQQSGVVLFGNDYLLIFDDYNNLKIKKRLHNNLIPIEYGNDEEKQIVATIHSHVPGTGDFITPTDICTLMLYSKYAKWETHYVVSDNYICIWDCEKNDLVIMTREAWENINEEVSQDKK